MKRRNIRFLVAVLLPLSFYGCQSLQNIDLPEFRFIFLTVLLVIVFLSVISSYKNGRK